MRFLLSCFLVLATLTPSFAQGQRVKLPAYTAGVPVIYEESTLAVGDYKIFDFTPSDGGKPFGGKPFRIECESRDGGDKASFWRGKVEIEGSNPVAYADQAWVFAGKDSPSFMTVRVIVDNATWYRHNITIDKGDVGPVIPKPSPYVDVITKAFAADGGKKEQAAAHAMVYRAGAKEVKKFVTGSDSWNWITVEYTRIAPLAATRLAISNILYETTRQLYDVKLTAKEQTAIAKVFADIAAALDACVDGNNPGPGPDVQPGSRKLVAVIVEETGSSASNRGAWFASAELAAKMKNGNRWRVVDQNVKDENGQTPTDVAPYIKWAKDNNKALPFLFIVDQNGGKVLYKDALPKDPAGLVALLTKWGG